MPSTTNATTTASAVTVLRQFATRLLLPLAVVYALMVGLGMLVTKVLNQVWPLTAEDAVNRELERERDAVGDGVSLVFSTIGSTPAIIAVTALAALVLVLRGRRWRAALFLAGAVTAQALVFLFTTMVIDRERPEVAHMDVSPPTSSFPSGHTSAAVALYCGLALILAVRLGRGATRTSWWWLLVAVPVGVALGRLYRGMHHPSDVVGSFVGAGLCLLVLARGVLDRSVRWGRRRLTGRTATAARGRPIDTPAARSSRS
jgi:membrane-associated phospholipid phosphatase